MLNKDPNLHKDIWFHAQSGHRGSELASRHNVVLEKIMELKYEKGARVLEVGCHDGKFLELLASLKFETYGIDINEKFVEQCKQKGLKALCYDVDRGLPYNDNFFDIIIALEVICHLISPINFLKEVHRVLKSGGGIIDYVGKLGLLEIQG